jgi:hypothetical protein
MNELMGFRDESCGDGCLFVCRLLDRALSISMVDGHGRKRSAEKASEEALAIWRTGRV